MTLSVELGDSSLYTALVLILILSIILFEDVRQVVRTRRVRREEQQLLGFNTAVRAPVPKPATGFSSSDQVGQ